MKQKLVYLLLATTCLLFSPLRAEAQSAHSYSFYLDLAQQSFTNKSYDKALVYFEEAHRLNPSAKEPLHYINLIKRMTERRTNAIELPDIYVRPEGNKTSPAQSSKSPAKPVKKTTAIKPSVSVETSAVAKQPTRIVIAKEQSPLAQGPKTIYLDSALQATQPKTFIQIQLNSYVILEGNNIERFLIITPDIIGVERLDRDHVKISALKRGTTFLHVWDATTRWTFNVEVIYQVETKTKVIKEDAREIKARPLRLAYSADWGAFYRGQSLDAVERESLNFLQWSGQYAETPYGDYDSYVVFNKFVESTELTGYSVGLTNGHIGQFKDFRIRGFDNTKTFSTLTVPGQYFRGVLFESEAFHNKFKYSYFQGKDRAIFGYLAPNVLEEKNSYVEGLKMTFNPHSDDQASLNYARGWGEARDAFLKKRVFSVQGQKRLKDYLVGAEQAYDEDTLATLIGTRYDRNDLHVYANFRDIDEDFATITNLPSNRGEIGGTIGVDKKFGPTLYFGYIDFYRERLLSNAENPDAINLDVNSSLEVPLGKRQNFRTSMYWTDTPGELSPHRNLTINNLFSKRFPIWNNGELSTFIGGTYQKSRFNFNPTSEYDRYAANAGFSLPLGKGFNFYSNYEYSWVDNLSDGGVFNPSVWNSGINYSKSLTDFWTLTAGFNYRDEEETEMLNSFLAGEDSTIGNVGLTYRPSADFEFYMDGRVRNVWAESSEATAFNEIDIRSGVRAAWDTMFSWSPSGWVEGHVYKDINNNKRRDDDEVGIAGVKVNVGKKSVVTNREGYYKAKVSAKKVQVTLDVSTVPQGFIFSTPALVDSEIVHHATYKVDFGLTTNSGIYGAVFEDLNGDRKPDREDKLISRAKITLDGGKEVALTDSEGNYFFQNIKPGRHVLAIDINSLPSGYLPTIKVKNVVEVSEGTTFILHIPVAK